LGRGIFPKIGGTSCSRSLSASDAGTAAVTRAKGDQKRQAEAIAATIEKYRQLSPYATGDTLAVSGEVNWMIAAAINANPRWFWHHPNA
jgi:hypothetical protein